MKRPVSQRRISQRRVLQRRIPQCRVWLGSWGLGVIALGGCVLFTLPAAADIAPHPIGRQVEPRPQPIKGTWTGKALAGSASASSSALGSAQPAPGPSVAPPSPEPSSARSEDFPEETTEGASAPLPAAGPMVDDRREPPKVHAGGRDVRAARASFIVGAAFLGILAAFWML
ncbi:MAG: hypothetical protein KC766_30535, partial [Myxococcales bacterium]|nr:hypothetical protein [Myxococcales bacterium]